MQSFYRTKKFWLFVIFIAMVAMAFLALPTSQVSAQAPGTGKIEGQFTNLTKDAKPGSTANLPVTLVTVPMTATTMLTTTTQADANGKFVFSNLDTISTTRYFVMSNYGSVDYYSDILNFASPLSTTIPAVISVYESTDDPSVIKVTQTHMVFDVQTPWLAVQEIIAIQNSSDRVYIGKALAGPHRITMSVPVLAKAINVQFDDPNVQDSVLIGDSVLTYTLPIGPGQDQIIFQYDVPFVPPTYEFNMTLPYGADKFGIYMPDVGEKITSGQLAVAPDPMAGTQGAPKFLAMAGSAIAPGTTIKATFSNLPATAPQSGGTSSSSPTSTTPGNIDLSQIAGVSVLTLAGVGVLMIAGIVAVGFLAYPFLRRRNAQPTQTVAAPATGARMDLLQQIADLDDDHEDGKVTDAEYQEKRAALKGKLLELGK